MGTDLQQILRSLCFNTEWKYGVFWKLKHRARMVLTWEDAYYNCEQHGPSESKCFNEPLEDLHGRQLSHDPLGLAVAKMSYHVYSLGEGIIGQLAITGKHQWIFADKLVPDSCSSIEFCDGWQSQFSAGIRTIVVVAVVPHGVVQLGSLNKVIEDMTLITHIRNIFSTLQLTSVGHNTSAALCSTKAPLCLLDSPAKHLSSEIPDCLHNLDKALNKGGQGIRLPVLPYITKHSDKSSYVSPLLGSHPNKAVELTNKHGGIFLEPQNQMRMEFISEGETSGSKDMGVESGHNVTTYLNNFDVDGFSSCDVVIQVEKFGPGHAYLPSDIVNFAVCDSVRLHGDDFFQNKVLRMPETSNVKLLKDSELESQTEFSLTDSSKSSLRFSAGCELHEALGPAFMKNNVNMEWEAGKTEIGTAVEIPEELSCSHLTFDSGSENLLEAVVAKICNSGSDVKSEKSFHDTGKSVLTTGKLPAASSQTKSAGCSINQSSVVEEAAQCSFNSSEVCRAMSSKGYSLTGTSTCSEQLERSSEPAKNNKKRARSGENCRPRPRDRQLIQDRIKELRELVPNGLKCSIDSLLERTIKHMLFLQSITKHADKLSKCAESKTNHKVTGMLGSSTCEQGSSWAVEVGSHLKVCSILVENLNKNGQMLVEMLCEECSHFLEIAEAIRSLGLTILKGFTEVHGEKTCIYFVVEGQNSKAIHRMDILWSLVQILQPKNTD